MSAYLTPRAGKSPSRAPFLGPLEEAQLLRGVRDQEILRLLGVQQPHGPDQGRPSVRAALGGGWSGNGPDLGPFATALVLLLRVRWWTADVEGGWASAVDEDLWSALRLTCGTDNFTGTTSRHP